MKKWQSWSTPKSQNCTREHVQTVCVSSSGGVRNAFFLDLHDSPPQVTPQPSGISALPPTLQSLPPANMGTTSFTSLTVQSPLHNCSWVTQSPQPWGQRELWPGHCSLCTPEALKQRHLARRMHVLQQKPAPARTPHTYKCISATFLRMKPSSKNPLIKLRHIWK